MGAKDLVRRLLYGGKPGYDYNELIRAAGKYPRYTPHRFNFQGMKLEVTDYLSVAWQLKEIFLDEQMNFKSKKPAPVIFDCGSNAGISLLYFKKLFPNARILAFEPDPGLFSVLKSNLQSNKIEGVELHNVAVWTNDKGISFGADGADGGSVFQEKNKISLPSVRLKDILEKEKKIDFLKMDIEGAEVDVLLDCKDVLHKIENIFVEYHSWVHLLQRLDELLSLFTKSGFRYFIHSLGNPHYNPFLPGNEKMDMDMQLNIYASKII